MLTQCIGRSTTVQLGVRANCVCPGWVRTAMADAAMDELAALHAIDRDDAYDLVAAAHVPARRAGEPEEVAEAVGVAGLAGRLVCQRRGAHRRRWRRGRGRRYARVRGGRVHDREREERVMTEDVGVAATRLMSTG